VARVLSLPGQSHRVVALPVPARNVALFRIGGHGQMGTANAAAAHSRSGAWWSDIAAGIIASSSGSSTNPVAIAVQPFFGMFVVVPLTALVAWVLFRKSRRHQ
jgi:hypothetical protein